MATLTSSLVLPSELKPSLLSLHQPLQTCLLLCRTRRGPPRKHRSTVVPAARLFGPAIFEASKLKVLFLGVDEKKHPGKLPRTYTLTHSDITSKLTLAISQSINNRQLQGWYNKLQRDEVVAEWRKVKEKMSLHVHCHISGGHLLLDLCARLRYLIFCKELPVVLKAFVHGDGNLFHNYPDLESSLVWVYFHSNIPEFNKVECWGQLKEAAAPNSTDSSKWEMPPQPEEPCQDDCTCCFPPISSIPSSPPSPPPHNLAAAATAAAAAPAQMGIHRRHQQQT